MSDIVDEFDRVRWNTFFMSMAVLVSQRSIDPMTKHGCVVTDDDHTVLSLGYNGPPRKCKDSDVPLTRPAKYEWIIHSESAAIINAARLGVSLKNSTFYVTGIPCSRCLGEIISVGAKRVYCGSIFSNSVDLDDGVLSCLSTMVRSSGIEMCLIDEDISPVFDKAKKYFLDKYKVFQTKNLKNEFKKRFPTKLTGD